MDTLVAVENTRLVAVPLQSDEVAALSISDPYYALPKGTSIGCIYLGHYEGENRFKYKDSDDYYIVKLDKPIGGIPRTTWFAYSPHWQEVHQDVKDDEPPTEEKVPMSEAARIALKLDDPKSGVKSSEVIDILGPTIAVPGVHRPVHLREPVAFVQGKPVPFNWKEVTKGHRIPKDAVITKRIIEAAKLMSVFRQAFDQPIVVTSWYRDPATNRRVRGASNSRHLYGDAVDWYPKKDGVTADTWRTICSLHKISGLAAGRSFFHTDMRPGTPKTWQYRGAKSFSKKRWFV